MAGWTAEIRRLDDEIAAAGGDAALDPPTDAAQVTLYVYRRYQRASLAGDPAALAAAETAIDRAIPLLAEPGDLYLLKANIAFKLHRLDDVRGALSAVGAVWDSQEGRLIRADLDFQHGRYREADAGYRQALSIERSWPALARLAHFAGKMGDPEDADRLYAEAQDGLTAKEMRSFAWLEAQRGLLHFARGRFAEARTRYRRAEAAYPGWWLVEEHIAELLAAEDRFAEAIAILEKLASGAPRPDLEQAVAELYRQAGDADRARLWAERALAGYLRSAGRGEVHFWHHLADYYAEVAADGPRAVEWARKDLALRRNFATEAALAWALYRDARFAEARDWSERALSSGAVDARFLRQAGMICTAAGDPDAGGRLLERARQLNPAVEKFHLHH
jgi:tetratricopeptide (TPR) repeat protein